MRGETPSALPSRSRLPSAFLQLFLSAANRPRAPGEAPPDLPRAPKTPAPLAGDSSQSERHICAARTCSVSLGHPALRQERQGKEHFGLCFTAVARIHPQSSPRVPRNAPKFKSQKKEKREEKRKTTFKNRQSQSSLEDAPERAGRLGRMQGTRGDPPEAPSTIRAAESRSRALPSPRDSATNRSQGAKLRSGDASPPCPWPWPRCPVRATPGHPLGTPVRGARGRP